MDLIADILLVAGALGAGFYCFVLAQRLKRFNDLEKGVGGAVAVMSAQVDDMTKMLDSAQESSGRSGQALEELTGRAEAVAQRLELMMASLHDVPSTGLADQPLESVNGEEQTAPPGDGPMFVRHPRTSMAER
ncbi:MAG: hypothetical protein HEP70_19750 [Rhodobiaceae bacterium]|jgi:hypothetical protein|nr:hypothetical protein [Rhodobiaceae bacterium]